MLILLYFWHVKITCEYFNNTCLYFSYHDDTLSLYADTSLIYAVTLILHAYKCAPFTNISVWGAKFDIRIVVITVKKSLHFKVVWDTSMMWRTIKSSVIL